MEKIIILLTILAVWLLISPIYALIRASKALRETEETKEKLDRALAKLQKLEAEIFRLGDTTSAAPKTLTGDPTEAWPTTEDSTEPWSKPQPPATPVPGLNLGEMLKQSKLIPGPKTTPPPLHESFAPPALPGSSTNTTPPPMPPVMEHEEQESTEPKEPFSLEKFMGVKLFAWLGGIAMFFGVILFVKYAFENNLIPPPMRIVLGYIMATGLLGGGLFTHRLPRYHVLAQAFCATGVLIFYGVTFAAHAVYKFPAFGTIPTFTIMAFVTFGAFFISVRFNALVVAVLGMLGGFMTPVLLSTGQDQVLGLFGYIALLNTGLIAVSRHSNWRYLTSFAAAGTGLTMMGWYGKFFGSGGYHLGSAIFIPMGILLGFIFLFLGGGWLMRRKPDLHSAGSAVGLSGVATVFAFFMLGYTEVAERWLLLYGFLMVVQLAIVAAVINHRKLEPTQILAAVFVFLHLALWTTLYLKPGNLVAALSLYLAFGILHSLIPVLLARRDPDGERGITFEASPWIGPMVLLHMVIPLVQIEPVASGIWFGIFMMVLLVIALALATRAAIPVLVSLFITVGLAIFWLERVPIEAASVTKLLAIATTFPLAFIGGGLWLARRLGENADDDGKTTKVEKWAARLLPMISAALPFILLVMALMKLPVPNPTPVFAVGLLMAAALSALAIYGKHGSLVLVALGGMLVVETVWHVNEVRAGTVNLALTWYVGIYAAFLLLPFLLRKYFSEFSTVWIASALSGLGHFLLIYAVFKSYIPFGAMGLIPAAFAVPALLAVAYLLKIYPIMDGKQRSRLAWFGGVGLLFITLIFPIQFERQWITISWAMEGALLLWLYHRVPHRGLQFTAISLLVISFFRLTLNMNVFHSYPRGEMAILNWHLYTYGIVAAALIFAARWFTDPTNRWQMAPVRGLLYSAAGILLFMLLNIEIADYFTPRGNPIISFTYGGNFARDMTYSIAWGLFSLGLLALGFWSHSKQARYAAVGLLVVTLLKVFTHDLAAIQNIFRIGALIGVAVIAFIASFLYQRFFDRPKTEK